MSNSTEPNDGDDAVIGRALRVSLAVIAAVVLPVCGYWIAQRLFTQKIDPVVVRVVPPTERQQTGPSLPKVKLVNYTKDAGISFVHFNGAAGDKLLPETMGSGVAWIDYDNDNDQDLFFINSKPWPWSPPSSPPQDPKCVLYQNDGTGKFRDVSAETGMDLSIYGMGVAVGDFDNDGWCDLFISAVGVNRLLQNQQGKFVDVTETSGVAGAMDSWSTSCGFVDYDNDGRLDLMVCNYVDWSKEKDLSQSFSIDGEHRAYGPPRAFGGTFPYLYHNEGNGKFSDVTEAAGLQVRNRTTKVPLSKGMGLSPVDINNDGFMDFVIANDTVQNFLLVNQKDGTFREMAEICGIAYDRDGNARGAMGIDVGAFRGDGTLAITIGNFANEPTALYLASGPGQPRFNDLAMATGLGSQTLLGLTFGIFFVDIDLDGRLDVVGNNGHLEQEINKVQTTQFYAQSPQVFWNAGKAGGGQMMPFKSDQTGTEFHQPMVGRAAAFSDFDQDGDSDIVFTANGGAARLIRNEQILGHHWLRLKLTGTTSNRSAIGARVVLKSNGEEQYRVVMPTRSYLSQCELPVTFGLGDSEQIESLTITWPSGKTQVVTVPAVDQVIEIVET